MITVNKKNNFLLLIIILFIYLLFLYFLNVVFVKMKFITIFFQQFYIKTLSPNLSPSLNSLVNITN